MYDSHKPVYGDAVPQRGFGFGKGANGGLVPLEPSFNFKLREYHRAKDTFQSIFSEYDRERSNFEQFPRKNIEYSGYNAGVKKSDICMNLPVRSYASLLEQATAASKLLESRPYKRDLDLLKNVKIPDNISPSNLQHHPALDKSYPSTDYADKARYTTSQMKYQSHGLGKRFVDPRRERLMARSEDPRRHVVRDDQAVWF